MSDLHSVHVDNIVTRMLERGRPIRHDIADELIELIHEYFHDGSCNVTVRIEGLSREQLANEDGVEISSWRKCREFRSDTGGFLAAVHFEWVD